MPSMRFLVPAILIALRMSAPVFAQQQGNQQQGNQQQGNQQQNNQQQGNQQQGNQQQGNQQQGNQQQNNQQQGNSQAQQVQFNQVLNINGDMNLNSFQFPDGSRVETFSQLQQQMIVNQNTPSVAASHVTGSTGQPFMQLSQQTMTIQTNNATNLVGGQIEMAMNTQLMQQMNISPDNAFVAQLSPDRQSWMVMEGIKNVNITDGTVRMLKLTSIDGEYMAIGRMTPETSNVLAPFGAAQQQQIRINGSGIQEVEFQDGFRMSVQASQPMVVNAVYKNGISSSMVVDGSTSVNNYRYLVTTNLGAVQPNLNNMMVVVQMPINAQRVMAMALQMGAGPQSSVQLGIEQRTLLQNPGGATGNLSPSGQGQKKRQNNGNNGTPTNGNAVANQLLLAPTFTPVNAPTVLDRQNGRIATTVGQLDGEFIVVMKMATQGGQQQGGPARGGAQPIQGEPARGGAQPIQGEPARGGAPPIQGEPARGGAQPIQGEPTRGGAQPVQGAPARQAIPGEVPGASPRPITGEPARASPLPIAGEPSRAAPLPIAEPPRTAPAGAAPAIPVAAPVAAIPGAVARPAKRQAPVPVPARNTFISMSMAELQLMADEQKYGGIQATKMMSEYLRSQGGAAAPAKPLQLVTRRRRNLL